MLKLKNIDLLIEIDKIHNQNTDAMTTKLKEI